MWTKFKKLMCKWDIHSFKLKVVDPIYDFPKFYCLWCEQDAGQVFGKPPIEVVRMQEKMMEARKEAYKKIGL